MQESGRWNTSHRTAKSPCWTRLTPCSFFYLGHMVGTLVSLFKMSSPKPMQPLLTSDLRLSGISHWHPSSSYQSQGRFDPWTCNEGTGFFPFEVQLCCHSLTMFDPSYILVTQKHSYQLNWELAYRCLQSWLQGNWSRSVMISRKWSWTLPRAAWKNHFVESGTCSKRPCSFQRYINLMCACSDRLADDVHMETFSPKSGD